MSPVDYDSLAADRGEGVPEDGSHIARLERAVVRETSSGTRMITEWSADGLYWECWSQLEGQGLKFAQEIIDGLGIDRSELAARARAGNEDALADELSYREGSTYTVTTKSRQVNGRWFTDVYDVEAVQGVQQTLGADVPIDVSDMSPAAAAPQGALAGFDDDDIPF